MGEQERYSYLELQRSLLQTNMMALKGAHYFLLLTPLEATETRRQEEALHDLTSKLRHLVAVHGIGAFGARPRAAPVAYEVDGVQWQRGNDIQRGSTFSSSHLWHFEPAAAKGPQ